MPAVGLTDHGSMAGAVELYKAASKAGIKPLLGLRGLRGRRPRERGRRERAPLGHLTLLAETTAGYHNLVKLWSRSATSRATTTSRASTSSCSAATPTGIIALSGCLAGRVCKALLDGDEPRGARRARPPRPDLREGRRLRRAAGRRHRRAPTRINPGLAAARRRRRPAGRRHGRRPLPARRGRRSRTRRCSASRPNDLLDNPNRFRFSTHEFYLKSQQEMYDADGAPWGDDMLAATLEIAERCNVELDLGALHLPQFDVPDGRPPSAYLRELCEEGLARALRRRSTPEIARAGSSSSCRRSRRWASPTTS